MVLEQICLNCMAKKQENIPCSYCGWMDEQMEEPGQQLAQGTILQGRYLLGRVLGHGGFGITYLAFDLALELKLAIKEYLPRDQALRHPGYEEISFYNSESRGYFIEGLEKFLEEAKTLARFTEHPGIASVRDYFAANGTAYMVMNYVEGLTLKDYLAQNGSKLDFNTALQIILPVIDALVAVHKEGILHRDVSPDNIYIGSNGIVKLLDFGAARHAIGQQSRSLSVVVKHGYAPFEQYSSQGKQGPWTDVYAVAATLYRAITGMVVPESIERIQDDELIPPSKMGVSIPGEAEEALMKALAVRAEQRFQTVGELRDTIQGCLIGSDPVSADKVPREQAEVSTVYPEDGAFAKPLQVNPFALNRSRFKAWGLFIIIYGFGLAFLPYIPGYQSILVALFGFGPGLNRNIFNIFILLIGPSFAHYFVLRDLCKLKTSHWIILSITGWLLSCLVYVVIRPVLNVLDGVSYLIMYGLFGLVLGCVQWLELRKRIKGAGWWILAVSAGLFLIGLITRFSPFNLSFGYLIYMICPGLFLIFMISKNGIDIEGD